MAGIYKGATFIVYHKPLKDGRTLFWQNLPKFSIINISKIKEACSLTKVCLINMPNKSIRMKQKRKNIVLKS